MIERGLSPRTVRYTHAVLRSALRQALQMAPVAGESCRWCQNAAAAQREMCSLTVEHAQAFLRTSLVSPHGPVLAVALTTGMRPSEYLALKWQDLDWTRQTVSVVSSVRRIDGRWCFSDTKRSRSRRPIRLQSWIVALLRELRTKASAQDLY